MFAAPHSTPPSTPGRGDNDDEQPSTTPAGPPPSHRTSASFTPAGQPPSSIFNSSFMPPSSATGAARPFTFGEQSAPRGGNIFAPGSTPGNRLGGNIFAPNSTPAQPGGLFSNRASAAPPVSSPPLPQASDESDYEEDAEGMDIEHEIDDMFDGRGGQSHTRDGFELDQDGMRTGDQDYTEAMDEDEDEADEDESDNEERLNPSQNPFAFLQGSTSVNAFKQSAISQFSPQKSSGPASFGQSKLSQNPFDAAGLQKSPGKSVPTNFGLSTLSQIQQQTADYPTDVSIGVIATNYGASHPSANLNDPDDLVLDMEELMEELHAANNQTDEPRRNHAIFRAVEVFWGYSERSSGSPDDYTAENIGPGEDEDNLTKFNFFFSLLAQIYQPTTQEMQQKLSTSRFGRSSLSQPTQPVKMSMPKVLLTWLNAHHDTNPTQPLRNNQNGYSANPSFWEIVRSVLLRGQFRAAITLLKGANFDIAHSAMHDGETRPGYKGARLTAVTKAVSRLIQVLQSCPAAVDDDNWEVWTPDWLAFKAAAKSALDELQTTAEGQSRDRDVPVNRSKPKRPHRKLGTANIGSSTLDDEDGDRFSFSRASRKAESAIPWSVYESLQLVYKQLIGDPDSLLQASLDWVEATVALTVWWDMPYETLNQLQDSNGSIRPSLEGSFALPSPPADDDAGERESVIDRSTQVEVFRHKLQDSFIAATSSPDDESGMFRPDSTNSVEIAIACAMALDMQGLAAVVRTWSATLFTAFVEVANQAGWIQESGDLMDEFDDDDLMVLGYSAQGGSGSGKPKKTTDLDSALVRYAELLESVQDFKRKERGERRDEVREGWELAAKTLGRLRDHQLMETKMKEVVGRIDLQNGERVDLILELCEDMGLAAQGRDVSERYATALLQRPAKQWGLALHYLARSHNAPRVVEITQYLLTTSLVHSTPYPSPAHLIQDPTLGFLLTNPRDALSRLSEADPVAARILGEGLSGYATLRKFYSIRDGVSTEGGATGQRGSKAAAALTSLIRSSADRIRGGLVDHTAEPGPVPTDALLCLVGEALVFLAPRPAGKEGSESLPAAQFGIKQLLTTLAAVEDLDTVPSGVRQDSENLLLAALGASQGKKPAELYKSQASFTKDTDGRSAASSFEMLMAASTSTNAGGSGTSSGVLMGKSLLGQSIRDAGSGVVGELRGVRRAWDWRKGLREGSDGAVVRRLARVAIAEAVGAAWAGGQ